MHDQWIMQWDASREGRTNSRQQTSQIYKSLESNMRSKYQKIQQRKKHVAPPYNIGGERGISNGEKSGSQTDSA
jgi:hypothetical protein